jgi:hypothetical protein
MKPQKDNRGNKFTFATLPVFRAFYVFSVLSLRYLTSKCYKNDNFLKNDVRCLNSECYRKTIFIGFLGVYIRYLNNKQLYFCKIVGRTKKWVEWQTQIS